MVNSRWRRKTQTFCVSFCHRPIQLEPKERNESNKRKAEQPSTKLEYERKRKRQFQPSWKVLFPWVERNDDRDCMYCIYCTKYPEKADTSSGLFKGCGQNGKFRKHTLESHNISKQHIVCEQAREKDNRADYEAPIQKSLNNAMAKLSEKNKDHLRVLTNTAYFVAEEELAFAKFSALCDLQEKNG